MRWMRSGLLAAACVMAMPASADAQAAPRFPDRVCNVRDHGARGSRIFLDTEAFQRAIDACAGQGGGTVLVPRGEYRIAPIFLRSHIRLTLAPYAELVATTDPEPYRVTPATRAYETSDGWMALINIADAQGVAITGEGRIDGQGAPWWERWRARAARTKTGGGTDRPRLIQASRSRDLLFEGVTVMNSPSFHLVLDRSERVTIRGMSFIALAHSPNTDAIDPVDTRDVLIENNFFDTGDDIVAIKSSRVDPAHPDASSGNIVIRHNRGRAGRGICIGSGTVGGVRHVLVEDNEIDGAMYGLRIKTLRGKGGPVQDVVFRRNRLVDVGTPFVFSSYYAAGGYDEEAVQRRVASEGGFRLNDQLYPPDSEPPRAFVAHQTPAISDVLVEDLTATGADRAGLIIGLPERPIERLSFRNVSVEAREPLRVRHAQVDGRGLRMRAPAPILERGAVWR